MATRVPLLDFRMTLTLTDVAAVSRVRSSEMTIPVTVFVRITATHDAKRRHGMIAG